MLHQTFEPQANLAEFVKWYWVLESSKEDTPEKNTIIPDGTMKMIFHYWDEYKHYPVNKREVILPKCFVIGQLTQPYIVEPTGETKTFFVCLQPNGFLPFTKLPIKEMENTAISLADIFWKSWEEIWNKILNANSTEQRIKTIEKFLLKYLSNAKIIDVIIKTTVDTIFTAKGKKVLSDIFKNVSMSHRQLQRKFSSTVWLSPKQLSKIVRIQATLKFLWDNKNTNLTQLAYKSWYYDQAHFIKDFKEFTGLTPKEFYGENLKMSLIFENKD